MVKHYIATEMLVNNEDLSKLAENELVVMKVVILIARIVTHQSNKLMSYVEFKCDYIDLS
jgi:hypothetical protein